MKSKNVFISMLIAMSPLAAIAQNEPREEEVHAVYELVIDDNSTLTLADAKHRAIENAKAEAIREAFGSMLTSDVIIDSDVTDGKESSHFSEVTIDMAKGDWLADTQEPKLDVSFDNGVLTFTAEVWGRAREIIQARPDVEWNVIKGVPNKKNVSDSFNNREHIYLSFRSPIAGYLAVYLLDASNKAYCLLPYKNSATSTFKVEAGKDYMLFDPESDANCTAPYSLTTRRPMEHNEIVVIFSPNNFTQTYTASDNRKLPKSLSTLDFRSWLLKNQRVDKELFVDKKRIKIENPQM